MQQTRQSTYRFGEIRKDYENLKEIVRGKKSGTSILEKSLNLELRSAKGTLFPAHSTPKYDDEIISLFDANKYWNTSNQFRKFTLTPQQTTYFEDIRKDYENLKSIIASKEKEEDLAEDLNDLAINGVRTIADFLDPSDTTSEHDQDIVIQEDAERYWEASNQLRKTLRGNSQPLEDEKPKSDDSNPPPSPYNLPWALRFFHESPKTTAGVLLATFETVSTGITSLINKDVLTNIHSNSMLAVYLSPVAAVMLTFALVAAYTHLKKDQDLDASTRACRQLTPATSSRGLSLSDGQKILA